MNEMGTSLIGQLIGGIEKALSGIQGIILTLAGSIIVLMIIIGGYQYMMGEKEGGKKTITAAIVGLIIIILAKAIVDLVNQLF